MKAGDVVTIYVDPKDKKWPEGRATLVERIWEYNDDAVQEDIVGDTEHPMEYWLVCFEDFPDHPYKRFIEKPKT